MTLCKGNIMLNTNRLAAAANVSDGILRWDEPRQLNTEFRF